MKTTSRGKSIYLPMEFHLHREEILSTSRSNFEAIYQQEIDGIPSFQSHPTMKRLMIGYKFQLIILINIYVYGYFLYIYALLFTYIISIYKNIVVYIKKKDYLCTIFLTIDKTYKYDCKGIIKST